MEKTRPEDRGMGVDNMNDLRVWRRILGIHFKPGDKVKITAEFHPLLHKKGTILHLQTDTKLYFYIVKLEGERIPYWIEESEMELIV